MSALAWVVVRTRNGCALSCDQRVQTTGTRWLDLYSPAIQPAWPCALNTARFAAVPDSNRNLIGCQTEKSITCWRQLYKRTVGYIWIAQARPQIVIFNVAAVVDVKWRYPEVSITSYIIHELCSIVESLFRKQNSFGRIDREKCWSVANKYFMKI